eukprot:39875-Eustigmatos_ZCMA.PRE.1
MQPIAVTGERVEQARVEALESDLAAALTARKQAEEELEAVRMQSHDRDAMVAQEVTDLKAQLRAADERVQHQ